MTCSCFQNADSSDAPRRQNANQSPHPSCVKTLLWPVPCVLGSVSKRIWFAEKQSSQEREEAQSSAGARKTFSTQALTWQPL